MRKYDLAVFDLDGTILDTLRDLSDSLNYALTVNGLPARTLDEARRFVGNGIRKLVERGVPAGTDTETVDAVFAAFKDYYKDHSMDATLPYPEVPELLARLKAEGFLLAVVSNKVDEAVGPLCERYFPGVFDAAAGEKPGVRKKPAPDGVDAVLAALGVPRERAVYIGDSEVDVRTAENAGLDHIAVTWGFREPAFLAQQGAKFLTGTAAELYGALTRER